ncbi:MAG: bifunctional ornithine acetyltransferase/N-acetylglutamate synthase, partial [Clostridiaceae bacterium]|nr:bifunctional ornithine acetyltransferase/N-acetylglutamate synthase [Clostridiaceae bacterium]
LPIVIDGQKSKQSLSTDFQQNLKEIMAQKEIAMSLSLAVGQAEATVWTCDFSYDYVKINGEYTT